MAEARARGLMQEGVDSRASGRRKGRSSSPRRSVRFSSGTTSTCTRRWRRSSRRCSFLRERDRGAAVRVRDVCRRLPRCGRSAPSCSAASATSWAGNTRSWSRSSSWAAPRSWSACCRPTRSIGWLAPVLLVTLRLVQGLALGGEYGGAATYVAEHAPHGRRGYDTSWIQTTATLGFFLALADHLALPQLAWTPRCSRTGAGAFRSGCRSSCWCSRSTSGSSCTSRRYSRR